MAEYDTRKYTIWCTDFIAQVINVRLLSLGHSKFLNMYFDIYINRAGYNMKRWVIYIKKEFNKILKCVVNQNTFLIYEVSIASPIVNCG